MFFTNVYWQVNAMAGYNTSLFLIKLQSSVNT